jgi:hypothetical protein
LRQAHLVAAARARDAQAAREPLAEADIHLREAELALHGAQQRLATDAADLKLPTSAEVLPAVEAALDNYLEALAGLCQAANAWLRDCAEKRAVAEEKATTATRLFEQRSAERAEAVGKFQRFAATELLQAAWPEAPLPEAPGP